MLSVAVKKGTHLLVAAVAVGILAVPAAAILLPPQAPQSGPQLANSPGADDFSVDALMRFDLPVAGNETATSPVGALLLSSAVATHFSGFPFFCFGDVNGDGITDLDDFGIVKDNQGLMGPGATKATGDLTGDGIVGLDDFAVVKFWFGTKSPVFP